MNYYLFIPEWSEFYDFPSRKSLEEFLSEGFENGSFDVETEFQAFQGSPFPVTAKVTFSLDD